jgi:hypothetical protein
MGLDDGGGGGRGGRGASFALTLVIDSLFDGESCWRFLPRRTFGSTGAGAHPVDAGAHTADAGV